MKSIHLALEEQEQLVSTFKLTADRRLRDRCQAVLMDARGRSREQIAEDLHVHLSTVYDWLHLYLEGGLAGLKIQWAPGRSPSIPEELAPEIVGWIKGGPESCGLDRANWTFAELAHYLFRAHGIQVSETTMREFCHRHGVRPYRPTYQYLRADSGKQQKAREELAEFKKKPRKGNLSC